MLESPARRFYFSGDTGYGPHFAQLRKKFASFELVALDSGQYDPRWPEIHMTPEQAAQTATELNTRLYFPEHIGRFALARHPWKQPFDQACDFSSGKPWQLVQPQIGAVIYPDEMPASFAPWWKPIQ